MWKSEARGPNISHCLLAQLKSPPRISMCSGEDRKGVMLLKKFLATGNVEEEMCVQEMIRCPKDAISSSPASEEK